MYLAVVTVGFLVVVVIAIFGNDGPFVERLSPRRRQIAGAIRLSIITTPPSCTSKLQRGTWGMRLRGLVPGWLTVNESGLLWQPLATSFPSGNDWLLQPAASLRVWRAPTGSWIVSIDAGADGRVAFMARSWHQESCAFARELTRNTVTADVRGEIVA